MSKAPLPPMGPSGQFFIGSMRPFSNDTLSFLNEWASYGDITRVKFGAPVGSPFTLVLLNHPDLIREMLVTKASKFHKAVTTKRVVGRVLGNNIFTADGDFWKRQRRLIQPAFHTKRISNYADTMVDYAQRMMADWQDNDPIDMEQEMISLTMQIVTKTLFNADVGEEAYRVGEAMEEIFKVINRQLNQILPAPMWIPTQDNRTLREAGEVMNNLLRDIIAERRVSGEDRGDLLSMLMLAQDEEDGKGMSDEQLLNEVGTLFGAGHETTAVTMTWTWYLLSQYPEVEAKLHEEVDRVLGGRPATMNDLKDLPYTEMVIKESMRLYPAAWAVSRTVVEDVEIGGYLLQKNNTVIVAPWVTQRDSRWFEQPDTFIPERFVPEKETEIPKYAYFPFGGGPRVCVGNAFAMMEARLILATFAQRFRFKLAPGMVVAPERRFSLHPKYGMSMIAKERVGERVIV